MSYLSTVIFLTLSHLINAFSMKDAQWVRDGWNRWDLSHQPPQLLLLHLLTSFPTAGTHLDDVGGGR